MIPTLVAASAAPRKIAASLLSPSASPVAVPAANGTITPATPVVAATRPTSRISCRRVSSPTQKRMKTTPSSANTSSTSPGSTQPRTAGPTISPARISPIRAGWPIRLKSSSPSFAAASTIARSAIAPAVSVAAAIGIGAAIGAYPSASFSTTWRAVSGSTSVNFR